MMGSNYQNMNSSGTNSMGFDNYLETDSSESWKSTLNFTGMNPVFPVEMFIELMEHKYNKAHEQNENCSKMKTQNATVCTQILSHISDDDMTPASLWKKQYLTENILETMCWPKVKKDLIKHFGQQNTLPGSCYSMQEKLLLFYSLMKNPDEKLSYFRLRVNIVASILEHGKFCSTKPAPQDWVRLLFLLGLSEDDRNLIIEEADFIYDLNGLCSLLLERKRSLTEDIDHFEETKEIFNASDVEQGNGNSNLLPENDNTTENEVSLTKSEATYDPSDIIAFKRNSSEPVATTTKSMKEGPPVKQEITETNPVLVADWDNENNVSEMQPFITKVHLKKRNKKGAKIKQKLYKSSKFNSKQNKKGGGQSICIICDKNFDTVGEFKKHNLEAHPTDKPTKCPHCDFERLDRRNVQIHIQRSHGNQNNPEEKCVCPQCNKSFTFKFNLNKHIRLSHGDGEKYKCHLCPHRCDYKTRLQEHINAIHTGLKNFKCDKCTFATSWRSQLIRHLWQVHNEGKGSVFTCEQCGYSTKRKELYRNHLMNVHNIGDFRPALCTLCGMTFKTKNYLMDHMYKVHKKTLRGKDTKAAMKEKAMKNSSEEEYFENISSK